MSTLHLCRNYVLSVFLLVCVNAYAQIKTDTIPINISGRVDTTDVNVNQIYHVFKNYLEARPDSIRVNPYWNKEEQQKGLKGNIALFYTPFYNLGSNPQTIFTIWKPFILSIEPTAPDRYLLRIALIKDELDPSKILTILNINAIHENGKWVLQNTIHDYLTSWNNKQYKYLKYVYPPTYKLNDVLAQKSIQYCDSIAGILGVKEVDTFTYFLCETPDDMGLLFGYEYYYLNYTTGLTIKWRKEIYAAKGSEFYPHEFVHMILSSINNDSINYIIEEGLACFLGELNTPKYTQQIQNLAKDYLSNKPTYTLENLLMNSSTWNGYQTAYPVGSIIAEIVFDKSGYKGLRQLIEANTENSTKIYDIIFKTTKLNKTQFEKEFRKRLRTYDVNKLKVKE